MNNILSRKHYVTIISIFMFVGVIALATYASEFWASPENTIFNTTIGEIAAVRFENGNSVNVSNLGPVLDYNDGANVEFSVFNRTNDSISLSVSLNIGILSDSLKNSAFKWVLTKYNDTTLVYDILESGDFSETIVGENTLVSGDSIPNGYSYYKLFVYIDGTVENNSNMASGNMNAFVVIDAV